MRKAFLILCIPISSLFAGFSLCNGDPGTHSPCAGWEALSQLGSLMPERIWEQEFEIFVDREAFKKAAIKWVEHDRQDGMHKPRYALACSNRYFLKSTMSGANSRIIDRYEEFQWSPFWKNPPRIQELRCLEAKIKKGTE